MEIVLNKKTYAKIVLNYGDLTKYKIKCFPSWSPDEIFIFVRY